jgi:hypothetical protein
VVTTGNLLIDAQAQLNATTRAGGTDSPGAEVSMKSPGVAEGVPAELSAEQRQIAGDFLKLTSELGAALAADKVDRFQ